MLQLENITKEYITAGETVRALRGISLSFRKSEFVSVLGPSGCGKTTILNIIGGLDRYTEGDLIIRGVSTKSFNDRAWDTYRNHSVGFVFQNYNLIPHQSVLQNVEIALTLSGVSKSERKRRAKKALWEVGLASQLYKKPSELSGGQMQRVAIARAIVNEPDIILADEPTGALDTETSVHIMELLKGISHKRLVIMVTHNADLAQRYSSRIVRMLDGGITDDSMPISSKETKQEIPSAAETDQTDTSRQDKHKPSMSLFTSFGLSLKNLISKKGRSFLTAFAGSIGIIGIALVYAVSQGMTDYVSAIQKDTLTSYPLVLEARTHEYSFFGNLFSTGEKDSAEDAEGIVSEDDILPNMLDDVNAEKAIDNDLHAFKEYLDAAYSDSAGALRNALVGIQYSYGTDLLVYTENIDGEIIKCDNAAIMEEILAANGIDNTISNTMYMDTSSIQELWQELLPGVDGAFVNDILKGQYDLIYGRWPNAYNEVVLVVDQNNKLSDMTMYALGLKSKDNLGALTDSTTDASTQTDAAAWSYAEICEREFRVILPGDVYAPNESSGLYKDIRDTDAGLRYMYDKGIPIVIAGIIRQNDHSVTGMIEGSIGYTAALTEYIIVNSRESASLKAQLADTQTDIFTGLPFGVNSDNLTDADKETLFRRHLTTISEKEIGALYVDIMSIPTEEEIDLFVTTEIETMSREEIETIMIERFAQQMGIGAPEIRAYLRTKTDEELKAIYAQVVEEEYLKEYATDTHERMATIPDAQLAESFSALLPFYTTEQCAMYYDTLLNFSTVSCESNLVHLGYLDTAYPSTIKLYVSSFENKDILTNFIDTYNESVDESMRIIYTDYVNVMMTAVTAIISAVKYVLISFIAVSLIVSSIMIGVITLISVQERTKEIGILRAIGASKRNVSGMFNAETMLIGFAAGILGVVITAILCTPVNMLLNAFAAISGMKAYLPVPTAILLVLVSTLLTLIAGLIPSRSAAKKDPVIALRAE